MSHVDNPKVAEVGTYIDVPSGGISSYARVATLVVAASDSKDTTDADYVCDGTDDQTEINNAINALPSAGGRVLLLEGTYNISASISILANNVTLAGQGNGTKIFIVNNADSAGDCNAIVVGNGSTALERVVVRDLQIDANGTNQTGNYTTRGIYFYGASGYLITKSAVLNCYVHDSYDEGIYLSYSNNNIIAGNRTFYNYDEIYLDTSNNNTITGNHVNGGEYDGIDLETADNNTITGNHVNSNSNEGIYLDTSNNNTITGNHVNSNSDGIYLDTSNNNTITGNQANSNSTGDGIYIGYSNDNTITGNQANSNSCEGIDLETADNNTIVGNRCQGNGSYGINVYDSTSDNNLIANNYLTGNTTAGINDAGTGTTIFGNIE